jgi:fucose 4-O-acetylase-like acetyltransferase
MVKTQYIESIDDLKGILMLLVITGHIALGTLNENILRYTIYSFHMPLFIAVSGYLLNIEKLKTKNFFEMIGLYLFRMIVPWCIAIFAYYLCSNKFHLSLQSLIYAFITPFYHLWYIPALLFFISVVWIFLKTKLPLVLLLIISLPVSLFSSYLADSKSIFGNIGTIRLQFFFYFCLAIFIKSYPLKINKNILKYGLLPILVCSMAFNMFCFFHPFSIAERLNGLILNCIVLILVFNRITETPFFRSRLLSWIGTNSLSVYLWHVFPIFLSKHALIYFNRWNETNYYLLVSFGTIVALTIIYVLNGNNFIRKYIFGIIK